MHVVDKCKVAYIVLRAFTYIISFHFFLKTFPSKSSNSSPIFRYCQLQPEAMETATQNDKSGGLLE